ncbi:hypothetical protein Droror1_Dr00023778 [Drosera rotundifolia]
MATLGEIEIETEARDNEAYKEELLDCEEEDSGKAEFQIVVVAAVLGCEAWLRCCWSWLCSVEAFGWLLEVLIEVFG